MTTTTINPMFSKRTVAMRQIVGELVDMSRQDLAVGANASVKAMKAETVALGWKATLLAMQAVLDTMGKQGIVLTAGEFKLLVYPKVLLRYSAGKLSPGDAFGRRVWDIIKGLAPRKLGEAVVTEGDWKRMFGRARAALEAFSLDVASRVGKTAKEHASVTLRCLDHIAPDEFWMHPDTAAWVRLEDRAPCEIRRHPLPTFGQGYARVAEWVPIGTVVVSPLTMQLASSADADGDQMVVDLGHPSMVNHAAGVGTYMHGVPSLKDTALVGFLNPDGKSLKDKLGYTGMLRIPVETFIETLNKLAEYSVTGIGQVGYNPSLAMATLGLVGEADFKPLLGTGYRRLYEDLLLAGMTEKRWELFKAARSPKPDGTADLHAKFTAAGFSFTEKEVSCYIIGRALAMAASQKERNGFVSERVMDLLGEYQKHIDLYGLVKALDAGRLDSVFLPQWQEILAKYPADNVLCSTLAACAPVSAKAAAQRSFIREVQQERRDFGIA